MKIIDRIQFLFYPIQELEFTHPDWFFKLENLGNFFDDRDLVIDLINTAPCMEAKYWLLGKYSTHDALLASRLNDIA